jgi:hypothetical protein
VQTTFIFNDLSIPNFILGEFGGLEKPVGQFRPNVQYAALRDFTAHLLDHPYHMDKGSKTGPEPS